MAFAQPATLELGLWPVERRFAVVNTALDTP